MAYDQTEAEGETGFQGRCEQDDKEREDVDDDDAHGIATTMHASHGHELESVAEEDEEGVDQEHHARQEDEDEELASLTREVGAGIGIEAAADDDPKEQPIKDEEDERSRATRGQVEAEGG